MGGGGDGLSKEKPNRNTVGLREKIISKEVGKTGFEPAIIVPQTIALGH